MLVTRIAHPGFFDDPTVFRPTDRPDIFQMLRGHYYVVALEYVLEQGEDSQYPMEDVLDRFNCHLEEVEVEAPQREGGQVDMFANSEYERLVEAVDQLVGRRAHNVEITDADGTGIGMVIDDSVGEALV